jgi:NADH dehydrogenase
MAKYKIVIVGGGFGGIKSALILSKNPNFEVTLISDNQNFRYYPMLFQTATGKTKDISSIPLSEIFKKSPIDLIYSSVATIDRKHQLIKTTDKKHFKYNALIIAIGVQTNYFHIKGLEKYSYGIKTIEDAERFKKHLHDQITKDHQPDLNYVVVGGGPTGVELTAMLPGYISKILKSHSVVSSNTHIDIIEASERLLPRAPKNISAAVERHLKKLGINIYTNTAVQSESSGGLFVNNRPIKSHTVVWTAGVSNHPFFLNNDFKIAKNGRVIVDDYLQAESGIYIIGDNADTPFSGMAQTAIHDGEFVANNLIRTISNRRLIRYKPKKPVYIYNAGPRWSIIEWKVFIFHGVVGSVLRGAADIVGFHSFEPWQMTIRKVSKELKVENNCPVCDQKTKP